LGNLEFKKPLLKHKQNTTLSNPKPTKSSEFSTADVVSDYLKNKKLNSGELNIRAVYQRKWRLAWSSQNHSNG